MAALRYVLLLQRDVPKAATFYSRGLGLKVKVLTERWAELEAGSTTLALKAVDGCVRRLSPFSCLLLCAAVAPVHAGSSMASCHNSPVPVLAQSSLLYSRRPDHKLALALPPGRPAAQWAIVPS